LRIQALAKARQLEASRASQQNDDQSSGCGSVGNHVTNGPSAAAFSGHGSGNTVPGKGDPGGARIDGGDRDHPRGTGRAKWWEELSLPQPDGRPLWQYRIPADKLDELERKLISWVPMGLPDRAHKAVFVLWAAERFRQSWRGEFNRWCFVAKPLGLPWQTQMDTNRLRQLADAGLEMWGLQAFHGGQGRMRVDMLVRQGGFPVAAVTNDTGGRVARWLETLVAHAAGQVELDEVALARLGQTELQTLPERWQSEFFAQLGAELAVAIVRLRREAEAAAPSGVPASVWLDQARPKWREEFPIMVGGQAGQKLIDGLMKVAPRKIAGKVAATRGFRRVGGQWQSTVRLALDGVLDDPDRLIESGWRRLRLQASGTAARWLSGDLAVAEALVEDGQNSGQWELTPSHAEASVEFPLAVPLVCQLFGSGEPVGSPIHLSGPLRSSVITCAPMRDHDAETGVMPEELAVVGVGSGGFRAAILWLLLPHGWQAEGGTQEEDAGIDGRCWWRIDRDTRILSPDGDVYLVRPAQGSDRGDAIEVNAETPRRLSSPEGLPLWQGQLTVLVREGSKRQAPKAGELWWRAPAQPWQPLTATRQPQSGRIDIAWRQDALIRVKETGILLPPGLQVKQQGDLLEVTGADGPVAVPGAVKLSDDRWRIPGSANGKGWIDIQWSNASIRARLRIKETIATWDGKSVPPNSDIYLPELDRYIARLDGQGGRMTLLAHVEDPSGKRLPQSEAAWSFADDLPLSAIARDIASLLCPEGLGCRVALNFNNGIEEFWYVRQYRDKLDRRADKLLTRSGFADDHVRLVGRPLHEPTREDEIASCSLVDAINHRPISLPRFQGDWIVYLKRNDQVLTQPQLVPGAPPGIRSLNPLVCAMSIADQRQRLAALTTFAEEAEAEVVGTKVRQLVDLAVSLGGLSPATFDIFLVMAERPLLAARMAMMATDSQLPLVLALADGLPFLWPMVGRAAWQQAAKLQFEAVLSGLVTFMPQTAAIPMAGASIVKTKQAVKAAQPTLGYGLELATDDRPLQAVANDFLTRANGRIVPARSTFSARNALKLPHWRFSEEYWQALDAPLAVALHAAGIVPMNQADVRAARQIYNRHPRWFAEGFTVFSGTLE
jgi:hypothetical protein